MEYKEILAKAKTLIGSSCRVCRECNGVACRGEIPGMGGKGSGSSFMRNFEKLAELKLNMDTLYEPGKVETSIELFGQKFSLPVFAAPIGGLQQHYGEALNDEEYSYAIVSGCKNAGTAGFTADGVKNEFYDLPLKAIERVGGWGIPTIKPWSTEEVIAKAKKAEAAGALAAAMDIDAAGLTVLAAMGKPVSSKSVGEIREITSSTRLPFIIKGIMTPAAAEKAVEAGAYGIVVSNHGGRVLDHTPATVEVLPEISRAVGGSIKIFVDGGVRSGIDIMKMLALGADAVLIGRPYAVAAYGGGAEGVELYTKKLGAELRDAMTMTGCATLADIDEQVIFRG
ncbi:MAG: alpha-hydroxy-acid oxidizing protein [Pseudomonadota bacterium]